MDIQFKEAAEAVKSLNETVNTRLSGMDREILSLKRSNRTHSDHGDLEGPETKAMRDFIRSGESKSLSVTSDGQGVSVRADWSDQIFRLVRESSPMRQLANVVSTAKNEIEVLVDRDEPASNWIAEAGTRNGTDASFLTRHKIAVSEHYALPSATLDMLDDSDFPVEQWLQGKVAARFARQEAAAFMTGDGSGKPKGILDYGTVPNAGFVWGSNPANYQIGAIYAGGATIDQDDLVDLVDSLKAPYLPGAAWMMTRAMRNQIRKLKDGEDRSLYYQSLDAAIPDRLLGYPVFLAEDMPAPATDEVGILFGSFREAYTIADRTGLAIVRDVYSQPGFVRWYVRRRVGGALTNPEAVKALVLGTAPA